jgi:molybdopterin converting factor small subunit
MRNIANRHELSDDLFQTQQELSLAREKIYQLNDVIRFLKEEINQLKSNDTNRQEATVA